MTPDRHRLEAAMPWIVIVGLLVLWQAVVQIFQIRPFILPSPVAIYQAFMQYREPIIQNSLFTLFNTLIGFAIGVVVGMLLALSSARSGWPMPASIPSSSASIRCPRRRSCRSWCYGWASASRRRSPTAFLLSFFPIAVNVATGLATVEPELEDVLRSLGASRLDVLRKVGLPRTMPYLFAALKVAITLAFVGAVISETIASE